MIIDRDRYLDAIKRRMWNGSIKVITGIRRCGKSFLLNRIFYDYLIESGVKQENIVTVSLETIANRKYRNPELLDGYVRSKITPDEKYYVFIDEIQFVKNFEDVLNGFLCDGNMDVYVTGSNSHLLSRDIITEFRGRGDEIRVHPLSFAEYMTVSNLDREHAFAEYMKLGGMPALIEKTDESDRKKYLTDLYKEVFVKDVAERHNLGREMDLGLVSEVLFSTIGSLVNPRKIADTLRTVQKSEISRNTVSSYIEYLEDSFLIEKANRYDLTGRKLLGATYKYYAEDMGIRNSVQNFMIDDEPHIFENIVYNELRIRGYDVNVGVVKKRVNKKKNNDENEAQTAVSEIDFVVSKFERKYYIQAAYMIPDMDKRKQETSPFNDVNDFFKKIIITMNGNGISVDKKGVITIDIFDFLLDDDILERC